MAGSYTIKAQKREGKKVRTVTQTADGYPLFQKWIKAFEASGWRVISKDSVGKL